MKRLTLFLLLLAAGAAHGQTMLAVPAMALRDTIPAIDLHLTAHTYTPMRTGGKLLMYSGLVVCGLVAGLADGQRETIVHNVHSYAYRHPHADPYWYNPRLSANRANGTTYAGGSVFAFTKDKLHLNQMIRSSMFVTQSFFVATLSIDDALRFKKFRPLPLLIKLATAQASYMVGKHLTHRYYDVF